MSLLFDSNATGLSILKDPFDSKNIERVGLVAFRHHDGKFRFYATVGFKNGDTKGEQNIDATSFDELISKTKAFIDTLKSRVTT